MGFVYFGTKDAPIGMTEQLVFCPRCDCDSYADVMVMSTYFHIYLLPLFPVSKEVNMICHNCGYRRYGSDFNATTLKNYAELKSKFKHPWYTFIFPAFVVFLIIMAIIHR